MVTASIKEIQGQSGLQHLACAAFTVSAVSAAAAAPEALSVSQQEI
jgi:hypothetical protein